MATPQEIQAHAAEARRRYEELNAPVALSPAPDPFAVAQADGSLPAPSAPPAAPMKQDPFTPAVLPPDTSGASAPVPPEAQSNVPPPVQDGSQEPVQVTSAAPGQRVQTAAAFNVGPPPISAGQVAHHGDAGANTTLEDLATANKTQQTANEDTAKVNTDIANEQAPILADKADLDGFLAQQAHEDMAQADVDAKKHFDVLMNYNKEIEGHVANQPTDLWGRAGVNKVAGIIGLVLGGLGGGATGGKNLVVDTLNTLVEQNLKQNEFKYEMLKGKVTTENQAYAQIMQTSKNKAEAADRYRLLANESAMSMLKQSAAKFAGPQAKAQAEQEMAQMQMKNVEIEQKIMGDLNNNYKAAAEIGIQTRQQDLQSVQLQSDARGAAQKAQDEQAVAYWEPSDKSHMTSGDASKLREQQGGAAQVQDILGSMIVSAQAGGIDAIINNKQGQANLQIALIQQKALSKRVTEAEAHAMSAMTGFLATGNTAQFLTAMGSSTVPEALFKAKQQFAQQHVTNLQIGYGLKPTADNPFVKAANAKYESNPTADIGGPSDSTDNPLSQFQTRDQVKEAAAAAQKKYSGYGGY